ncbi:MAG: DUF2461 domain-containing protein [Bryobacteraceae bacterium]|nr:DUF2461 domain-containing protein [Bryobacteraceae bacterium]
MPTRFPGFPREALTFFDQLAKNNNREWFQAHKQTFEEKVKAPMIELVGALNAEFASFAPEHVTEPAKALYRIYRDTRFSADKTPYKSHIAANFPRRGLEKHAGAGYYFSVSSKGIEVAGGVYMPGPDELLAIRNHLASEYEEFRRLTRPAKLRSLAGDLQGNQLSRPPKGFPADHPAVDLLRYKQLYYYLVLDPAPVPTPKLLGELVKRFRAMQPVVDFLNVPLLKRKREMRPDPALTLPAPFSRRQGAGR